MNIEQDWSAVSDALDAQGWAVLPRLLDPAQCAEASALYDGGSFRSTVQMARHGFGRGEYRYFAYPLPPLVQALRSALYPHLAPIADRWHARMCLDRRFQGDAVVFAVNQRPVAGSRGDYRVTMRHGVSEVRAGRRQVLGIIFHDAA